MDAPNGSLESAVRGALTEMTLTPADRAATELALVYARHIDLGEDAAKLGPGLLAVLTALGMTPAARAQLAKGGTSAGPSPLDELRARRAARAS